MINKNRKKIKRKLKDYGTQVWGEQHNKCEVGVAQDSELYVWSWSSLPPSYITSISCLSYGSFSLLFYTYLGFCFVVFLIFFTHLTIKVTYYANYKTT